MQTGSSLKAVPWRFLEGGSGLHPSGACARSCVAGGQEVHHWCGHEACAHVHIYIHLMAARQPDSKSSHNDSVAFLLGNATDWNRAGERVYGVCRCGSGREGGTGLHPRTRLRMFWSFPINTGRNDLKLSPGLSRHSVQTTGLVQLVNIHGCHDNKPEPITSNFVNAWLPSNKRLVAFLGNGQCWSVSPAVFTCSAIHVSAVCWPKVQTAGTPGGSLLSARALAASARAARRRRSHADAGHGVQVSAAGRERLCRAARGPLPAKRYAMSFLK